MVKLYDVTYADRAAAIIAGFDGQGTSMTTELLSAFGCLIGRSTRTRVGVATR
jgi:hypothetical protein